MGDDPALPGPALPAATRNIQKGTTEAALPHIGHLTHGYNFLHKTEAPDINRLQPPDKFALSRRCSGSKREAYSWPTSTRASKPRSRVCGATREHWRAMSRRR